MQRLFIALTKASSLFTKSFSIKECEENILKNLLKIPSRSPLATCPADVLDITDQRCNILQKVSCLKNLKANCSVV